MNLKISFLFACLFTIYIGKSQVVNEKRIEFDLKENFNSYNITPFGENGILLYANDRTKDEWKIEKYDSNLELSKTAQIPVERKKFLSKSVENEDNLNLLFCDKSNKYTLYNISSTSLKYFSKSGVLPKKAAVDIMVEYNNIVYMSLTKGNKPMLVMVNYNNDMQSVLPLSFSGYSPKHIKVVGIEAIPEYKEVLIYVRADNGRAADMFILKMDENGEKTKTLNFASYTENRVKTVTGSAIGNGEYIFSGTYSTRAGNTAQGMYISKVSGENVKFITYVNFTEFEDFFSYLSEKKQEKVEKKVKKKKAQGKDVAFDYLLAMHQVQKMGDKYIFLAEAFYPTYRTETMYNAASNTYTYRQVFDGYRYTHATLSAFNTDGEKLWDRTFPLGLVEKPFTVKKYVRMKIQDDQIDLMYATGKYLDMMSISEDNDLKKESKSDLIKTDDEEKIKRSYSNLQYWYGDYFVAYGEQKIKGDENAKTKNRIVYFINKIGVK